MQCTSLCYLIKNVSCLSKSQILEMSHHCLIEINKTCMHLYVNLTWINIITYIVQLPNTARAWRKLQSIRAGLPNSMAGAAWEAAQSTLHKVLGEYKRALRSTQGAWHRSLAVEMSYLPSPQHWSASTPCPVKGPDTEKSPFSTPDPHHWRPICTSTVILLLGHKKGKK